MSTDVTWDENGYRRLNPMPDEQELSGFYETSCYELLRAGDRAPDIARLSQAGAAAEIERDWLRRATFPDLVALLSRDTPPRAILEIGCGTGELLEYLGDNGFEAHGLELASTALSRCREKGLSVSDEPLGDHVRQLRAPYDAVIMINVLEHVLDPLDFLERSRDALGDGGRLLVQVPNDFNDLQRAAVDHLGIAEWWIARPDHVNYFDFSSLEGLLRKAGLEPLARSTSFPLELMLLLGHDYVSDPSIGAGCHRRRVEAELAMPAAVRRRLYSSLAGAGFGRHCIVLAERAS